MSIPLSTTILKPLVHISEHRMDPKRNTAALKVVVSASTTLGIMLVEFVWLMRDEVRLIWPRLRTSWQPRIYVFARYMGLICQIFNVYFAVRMYLGIYTSPTGCRVWFTYQALIVQSLLCCVEGLLMLRLYALFLKSRMILVMLLGFVIAQVASMVVSVRLSFPSNKYTTSCWMERANPGNAFFSATTMTTNLVIFFMTFWRYFRLPTRWTREALGRVIIRDSALSLMAISVIMLFLTLCSLEVIKPSMSGNVTFCWLVLTLWVSIGRVIVNHENIPRDERGVSATWKGTVQLTSQIEMGESVLSLDTQCSEASKGSTESTLRKSLSTPTTKASQLSGSSSVCTSDETREWFGEVPAPVQAQPVRQDNPQLSCTVTLESSVSQDSTQNDDGNGASLPPTEGANGNTITISIARSPGRYSPDVPSS